MWDFNDLAALEHREGTVYYLRFDDGLEGELDLSEYRDKGPVFAALKDVEFCRQARIEGGTIAWPNGADIAPETLYEKLERAGRSLPTGS